MKIENKIENRKTQEPEKLLCPKAGLPKHGTQWTREKSHAERA
ncbi:MAG: hypothetical protein NWF10_04990 [Candidatus Bathyarchaeota archaeon]|nr:hypothetical protein [Candidatus Bathyarchaeota archaeon]